jgi:hypothetical protein
MEPVQHVLARVIEQLELQRLMRELFAAHLHRGGGDGLGRAHERLLD